MPSFSKRVIARQEAALSAYSAVLEREFAQEYISSVSTRSFQRCVSVSPAKSTLSPKERTAVHRYAYAFSDAFNVVFDTLSSGSLTPKDDILALLPRLDD
jgi:hypothetical protein